MTCITAGDPQETQQLERLAGAIEQRVGRQRFSVWFDKSTKLRLTSDGPTPALEISVPNDFISDWITKHFARAVQDAAGETLGCSLEVVFVVAPRLFEDAGAGDLFDPTARPSRQGGSATGDPRVLDRASLAAVTAESPMTGGVRNTGGGSVGYDAPYGGTGTGFGGGPFGQRPRLRHDLDSFVVGPANQLAYECAADVSPKPRRRALQPAVHPRQRRPGQNAPAAGHLPPLRQAPPDQALGLPDRRGVHQRVPGGFARQQGRRLPPPRPRPGFARHRRRAFPGRQEGDAGGVPAHFQRHRGRRQAGRDGQRRPPQDDRQLRREPHQPLRQRHGRAGRRPEQGDADGASQDAGRPAEREAVGRDARLDRHAGDAERAGARGGGHADRRPTSAWAGARRTCGWPRTPWAIWTST